MISSSVKTLLYCASGFSAECSWFFCATLANCSKPTPSFLYAYSMPAWPNTAGIVPEPSQPSTGMTPP